MPPASAKPKQAVYRIEYAVRAVVAVEVVAESFEAALSIGRENPKWATEGLKAELCDTNIKLIGISDTAGWRVTEEK